MITTTVLVLGGILLASAPGSADESVGEAGTEVVQTSSGFSIHTQGGELPRILTAIGDKAGFSVVDAGHGGRQPIAVAIDDAPLDQTLRRLLRGENYVIVYRSGAERPEISGDDIQQIILLSPAGSVPPAQGQGASPLAGPQVASRGVAAGSAALQPGTSGTVPTKRRRLRSPTDPNAAAEGESSETAAQHPGAQGGPPPGVFGPAVPMPQGGEAAAVAASREPSEMPGAEHGEGSAFGLPPPGVHPDVGDDVDPDEDE